MIRARNLPPFGVEMHLFDARLESGAKLDHFLLERKLGAGAFGEVWLAVDEGSHGFRKKVALKVLSQHTGPERVEALLREARLCAHFNHPNVIDVLGVGQYRDVSWIVMDYISGQTLAEVQAEFDELGQDWPRPVTLEVGISIAEALHHAWVAQDGDGRPLRVVHRDLKPENVMISDHGVVVVGDFGVSQAGFDAPEEARKARGTPHYMPPEAWLGGSALTPAADLFSLGVILWELCLGRRFFQDVHENGIIDVLVDRSPAAEVAQMQGSFPRLAPLLERLLQRRPEDRPQDALEVAAELRHIRDEVRGSGDLVQFIRLVRAGRIGADAMTASLADVPALGEAAAEWQALVHRAESEPEPEPE